MAKNVQELSQRKVRVQEWIARVNHLVAQIEKWSLGEGWEVERKSERLFEDRLGEYEAPAILIHPPGGEIEVNPIALRALGGDGWVEVQAFPTISRVKLIGEPGGWKIMTDSNVPLRVRWGRKTFVQLVRDLLS